MNYLLTVSYANEKVAEKSYARLIETMKDQPCTVLLFDNHYPLNRKTFMVELCEAMGFEYHSYGENIGLYAAWNYLIKRVRERGGDKAIFYDGDHYPEGDNWHLALLNTLGNDVVHSTLRDAINWRELLERGHNEEVINGYKCRVTFNAVKNSACAFDLRFLEYCGGLNGSHRYYGGNEIGMWDYYTGKKWIFLEDFSDNLAEIYPLHDWQYGQYKLLYAHRGLDMSFDDYVKTNPALIEGLEKSIFG